MNVTVPLNVIIFLIGGGLALFLGYRLAIRMESGNASLVRSIEKLRESLDKTEALLLPAAEELRQHMPGIPKLLESVARVGQAQLEMVQQQRQEQAERTRNPFGRTAGPMPARDVESANREYEIDQAMRAEGISREEAQLRMNPANTASVWDGDELTRGWAR